MSEAAPDADAAWQVFMTAPAAYIDEDRLPQILGGEIGAPLAKALRGTERVRPKLSALIIEREALPAPVGPDELSAEDRAIALATSEGLAQIVLKAGAVLWSGAIANAVRGREVAALQAAIGEEVRSFAIAHRASGGTEQPLEPMETLRERIISDGWRCYAGWCQAVPIAVGARARLKAPPGESLASIDMGLYNEVGPAVLRLAAA